MIVLARSHRDSAMARLEGNLFEPELHTRWSPSAVVLCAESPYAFEDPPSSGMLFRRGHKRTAWSLCVSSSELSDWSFEKTLFRTLYICGVFLLKQRKWIY